MVKKMLSFQPSFHFFQNPPTTTTTTTTAGHMGRGWQQGSWWKNYLYVEALEVAGEKKLPGSGGWGVGEGEKKKKKTEEEEVNKAAERQRKGCFPVAVVTRGEGGSSESRVNACVCVEGLLRRVNKQTTFFFDWLPSRHVT
jgi:hypothetical protein